MTQSTVEHISQQIKISLDIDNKYNTSNSTVPAWEELEGITQINKDSIKESNKEFISTKFNSTKFKGYADIVKTIYKEIVDNYVVLKQHHSILEYLQYCRNTECKVHLGDKLDKKTFIEDAINSSIGSVVF